MLPIRRVVLHKHGVGYFERKGEIEGDASIDLYFRAAEMNDVLKSLTTVDFDGGLVAGISYESTTPLQKQVEEIAIRLADGNSLTSLIEQIKGARVAVQIGPQKLEGLVVGIETVTRKERDSTMYSNYLNLFVDGASLQSFDLFEVKSLTLLDEGLRNQLQHLLDVLISAKKKDLKKLTIFGKGQGKRSILASYTLETPVWKTSYRVLLYEEKAVIQGWAIVDNTTEEDWDEVSLTFVAGLPISFVHDLYSPRYTRRPIVAAETEAAYGPPVIEAATGLPAPAVATVAEGMVLESRLGTMPTGAILERRTTPQARTQSIQVQTRTVEISDLFQYEIKNPVTVKRKQSALVPILQGDFDGKRVAVYNPEVRAKNPMSAILFKNTTGMMLDSGPVTVLEKENYVGESMLDTLKPNEERLVPFSVELGCVITLDHRSERKDIHCAKLSNGTLHLHHYCIERKIYVINNKTNRNLDLFLEHRFRIDCELVETEPPVEKTDHCYRFRFEVPPNKTVTFTVSERRDEADRYEVQKVRRDQIGVWLESKYIELETFNELQGLVELNERAAELQRRIQDREGEIKAVFQNHERLRQNLQALGTSQDEKGLRERYVSDLSKEEDQLLGFRAELIRLREEKGKVEDDLRLRIGRLKFEAIL